MRLCHLPIGPASPSSSSCVPGRSPSAPGSLCQGLGSSSALNHCLSLVHHNLVPCSPPGSADMAYRWNSSSAQTRYSVRPRPVRPNRVCTEGLRLRQPPVDSSVCQLERVCACARVCVFVCGCACCACLRVKSMHSSPTRERARGCTVRAFAFCRLISWATQALIHSNYLGRSSAPLARRSRTTGTPVPRMRAPPKRRSDRRVPLRCGRDQPERAPVRRALL